MEIAGRLTSDAKVSVVKGDRKVVDFSIAINERYRRDGETQEKTTYVDCAYWLNAGIGEYLRKGAAVVLSGRLGSRAYITGNGEARGVITFTASNIKILSMARGQEGQSRRLDMKGKKLEDVHHELSHPAGEDDDLPF